MFLKGEQTPGVGGASWPLMFPCAPVLGSDRVFSLWLHSQLCGLSSSTSPSSVLAALHFTVWFPLFLLFCLSGSCPILSGRRIWLRAGPIPVSAAACIEGTPQLCVVAR